MNFCSHCGHAVELKIPEGDSLPRYVCPACGVIHYQNPKMVVGSIPVWDVVNEVKKFAPTTILKTEFLIIELV